MFGIIQDEEILRIDDSYLEEQVKAVSMDEIETTTDSKKVLFTFGLSSCIGIYLYSKNFGLLGHINPGDLFNRNFEHEFVEIDGKRVRTTGQFKQIGMIMYQIRKNLAESVTPIKIGLVVGVDAYTMSQDAIQKLDFAIDAIIEMTRDMGLSIEKQEPIVSPSVIVDTEKLLLKTEVPRKKIGKL